MEASGLDISDLKLRLVKIKKAQRVFVLKKAKELDVVSGLIKDGLIVKKDEVVKLLKKLRKANKGKEIIACLPEKQSFIKIIEAEENQVMTEFAKHLPFPIEEVYLDWKKLNKNKFLVGACRQELVKNYLDVLRRAGFHPIKLEIEAETLARVLHQKSPCLIIDLGLARTTFVMAYEDIAQFTTSFPSVLQEKNSKEILQREISQLLSFCEEHLNHSHCPQEIILCGSGAKETNLKLIAEISKLPTRLGDFRRFFKRPPQLSLAFTTAFGLALSDFYL